MLPVLFRLGPLTAWSYGALMFLGICAGVLVCRSEFRRRGFDPAWVNDLTLLGIVAGLLGGKLLFLATVPWEAVRKDPKGALGGGLVWYGVVAAVIATSAAYARWREVRVATVLDMSVLGLAIGSGFGRIGCLLAGCCHGRPASWPWTVTFTDPLALAPRGVPLYPTQLYMALHAFAVFAVLWAWRTRTRRDGELLLLYLLLYAPGRYLLEGLRGDAGRGTLGGVSLSQGLSVVALAVALAAFLHLRRRV